MLGLQASASSKGRGAASGKIERPGLTEEEIEEIREAFNLFDTDGSGKWALPLISFALFSHPSQRCRADRFRPR